MNKIVALCCLMIAVVGYSQDSISTKKAPQN
jgi:hypothetical protein